MFNAAEGSSLNLLKALQAHFGFTSFRPAQEGIIQSIMEGRDIFAVLPTGGGKSLCYQLPARLLDGIAVVISPLISLMKDQVDAASERGISAAFINSTLGPGAIARSYSMVKDHAVELLYISPERLVMPQFLDMLKSLPLSLFAIDEAHCISEWGHDFRPDYCSLSMISSTFPGTPIAAFTATATLRAQEEIIRLLDLRAPRIFRGSCNRPNIFYGAARKADLAGQILAFLKNHYDESGIIYRTTRKAVMETSAFLSCQGIRALPYHGGLTIDERKAHQEAFLKNRAQVIVGTIAFGMGIDKSDVRFVIHGDLPRSIEGYYQETGRAGRDGKEAHCLLLFGEGDLMKIRHFINQMTDDDERENALSRLRQMHRLATGRECRRRGLLAYFGEDYQDAPCGMCDVCRGESAKREITLGWEGIAGKKKKEKKGAKSEDEETSPLPYDALLFERLREARHEVALREKRPAYCIVRDRTLRELCRRLPGSMPELETIYGIGPHKLIRYGELFLRIISRYLKEKLMERMTTIFSGTKS
jgi:ATP-dependent DNA helicase RecQ